MLPMGARLSIKHRFCFLFRRAQVLTELKKMEKANTCGKKSTKTDSSLAEFHSSDGYVYHTPIPKHTQFSSFTELRCCPIKSLAELASQSMLPHTHHRLAPCALANSTPVGEDFRDVCKEKWEEGFRFVLLQNLMQQQESWVGRKTAPGWWRPSGKITVCCPLCHAEIAVSWAVAGMGGQNTDIFLLGVRLEKSAGKNTSLNWRVRLLHTFSTPR